MNKYKFEPWLNRWKLTPDGLPFITHTSQLLPVKTSTDGIKAMLKITDDLEEQRGNALMAWWGGCGAAPVISHENEAILLERATGPASLSTMSREVQDTEACRILCLTANQLHIGQKQPIPQLTSLHDWFHALKPVARIYGGILKQCAEISEDLLSSPHDVTTLHGDLHHANSNQVYEVLNRKRNLTLPMIRKLHSMLGIPLKSLVGG